jgi:hypothetical protein
MSFKLQIPLLCHLLGISISQLPVEQQSAHRSLKQNQHDLTDQSDILAAERLTDLLDKKSEISEVKFVRRVACCTARYDSQRDRDV